MLRIEFEREDDGRWIAEIPALPGVMAYGATQREARAKVEALALRALAGPVFAPTTYSSVFVGRAGARATRRKP